MRRALILCSCCAVLLFGGVADARVADGIDWHALPYFQWLNDTLKVSTNEGWRGAHKVSTGRFDPQRDSAFPKVAREFIWAPTCGSAAQRVTFSTSFLSPGEPDQGQLYLTYGIGNQLFGGRPYHSASISVNGVELGRLGDIARLPRKVGWTLNLLKLPRRALEAVHYGRNSVVIHVDRAALKPGEPCTRPAATSGGNVRYIGILADLEFGYAADVRVRTPDVPSEAKLVNNGAPATVQGTSRATNEGPASALDGEFTVSVTGPGTSQLALATPLPPLRDCERSPATIRCFFDELKPGQTTGISILAGTVVNYGFFSNGAGTTTLQWSVTARNRDPKASNNSTKIDLVLCAPDAGDPRCAGAG